MKDEYIIINRTNLEKRIEELINKINSDNYSGETCDIFRSQIEILKQTLSQSTPLIPEIEKAYNWGYTHCEDYCKQDSNDCISNLKLDV